MASTYSSDLKLELMATGENAGTWGDKTNTNLNLVQQAIAGFEQVTLTSGGTVALVMSDGALSNARNLVIKFATITAAASTVCTIPDSIEKFYIFDVTGVTNPTNLTIKTASGTGFTPDAQKIYAAYSDGTNLKEVSLDTLGGSIGTAQIADDAVTNAKIADDAIRAAQLSDNAVVTASILNANVTTDKLADDAVTAAKLADTSVTAGAYTAANITVDAQGRLTAAASGSAAANFRLKFAEVGPNSGNITANPAANNFYAYLTGAGGGAGGFSNQAPGRHGGAGGSGGSGFFSGPVTGGAAVAYSLGAGGTKGTTGTGGTDGNAGAASTISTFTSNGGGGGGRGGPAFQPNRGQQGTAGTAPGGVLLPEKFLFAGSAGLGTGVNFTGANGGGPTPTPGDAGQAGGVIYFDDGNA